MKKTITLFFLAISFCCTAQNIFLSESEITLDFNESMVYNDVFVENPSTDTLAYMSSWKVFVTFQMTTPT